jgi:threonine/homoserine/homoserine lactone efflux protein
MIPLPLLGVFLTASIALNITPGPDMLYVLGRSLAQGRRGGLVAALGIGAGTLIHIGFAAVGLSALLMTSALAFTIVKWVGAVYLMYLGARLLRGHDALAADKALPAVSLRRAFAQAFMTNLLNPKVALFFLAFLPQFIPPGSPHPARAIVFLGLLFDLGGTTVCMIVACIAGSLQHWLRRHPRAARGQARVCGALFVGLGVKLALTER